MRVSKIVIKDIRSLVDAVLEANEELGTGNVWWRGQRNASWSLKPSIFREDHEPYREYFSAREFMAQAPARHVRVPGDKDYFAWLFLMQHHGLPTRLLDWTQSPLVATFFAVESVSETDQDGCLYAMNPGTLNVSQGGANLVVVPTVDDPIVYGCVKKVFDEKATDENRIIAIAPSVVDMRIMAQLSMFTLHGANIAIEELPRNDRYLRKYVIPAKAKGELEGQLTYGLGIRGANLFPDLDHLAKEIRSHKYITP